MVKQMSKSATKTVIDENAQGVNTTIFDLNGKWQFRKCACTARKPDQIKDWHVELPPSELVKKLERWLPANVPGCVHNDLQSNRLIDDPFHGRNEFSMEWIDHADWEYKRLFTVTKEMLSSDKVDLLATGLDTLATVFINDKKVASTENMFIGYRFPIKQYLKAGENTIRVLFETPYAYIAERKKLHPYDNGVSFGGSIIRKQHSSFSWDWAPSLASFGIFKSISIEARNGARIENVAIDQKHSKNEVKITLTPKVDSKLNKNSSYKYSVLFENNVIESSETNEIVVKSPQLWWPNGQGDQPLYTVVVELIENGTLVDRWSKKIGLRTIKLDRKKDQWGESFQFVVNGRPIYCKGANWVPPYQWPAMVTRERYDNLLTSAKQANMNMLRIWGGGLYEQDSFYELCDEKGLMIWHDFMFSCTLYPSYKAFIDLITIEAEFQVQRLAHHACMALWCGNNELELHEDQILETTDRKKNYERIFYKLLPSIVEKFNNQIPYWPGSPHNPLGYEKGHNSETHGDGHCYWDACGDPWSNHAATKFSYRFWSEFGMQSFSSLKTTKTFAKGNDLNAFSPVIEGHEKNSTNHLDLVKAIGHRYLFPKDFKSLIYLSQLNQAYYVGTSVEHQRKLMPRSMGSLYWQLNDTWPAISWSSIEFNGQWKALHHAARKFYAPTLVVASIDQDETKGNHNRKKITVQNVRISTVHDDVISSKAKLNYVLYHVDGSSVKKGTLPVTLTAGSSKEQEVVNIEKEVTKHGRENLLMRIWVEKDSEIVSERTLLFVEPRKMVFTKETVDFTINALNETKIALTLKPTQYHHGFCLDFTDLKFTSLENFFDLYPGVNKTVTIEFEEKVDILKISKKLSIMSYADSY